MSPPSEATIQALAATFTPSLEGDRAQLRRVYSTFLYVYGDLPAGTRTTLALLVRLIEALSWLRYGRSFAALSPDRRTALCRRLANAPISRLREGDPLRDRHAASDACGRAGGRACVTGLGKGEWENGRARAASS